MNYQRVLRQIPMVHVYPQSYQHQDAEIIGNRAGLGTEARGSFEGWVI